MAIVDVPVASPRASPSPSADAESGKGPHLHEDDAKSMGTEAPRGSESGGGGSVDSGGDVVVTQSAVLKLILPPSSAYLTECQPLSSTSTSRPVS